MKPQRILKDFNGTQDGLGDGVSFTAGTTALHSDWLAGVAVKGGLAEAIEPDTIPGGPHPELVEDPDAPNELVEGVTAAESRETKVIEPAETKPGKALAKMSKAELVAHALEVHGLELAPDNLTARQMIEAIEKAAA
ncbi:MAG: hypothetical protein J0I75_15615 [Hyphomicrobium sp.]|nr:hypothetical protein [Hyphomicrobium sp.]